MTPLDLDRHAVVAAPQLLGLRLVSTVEGELVEVSITEVEAYGGADDPASHAHRGRTPRNATMFGPPGRLYVYRSYGIHWCANIVTGCAGEAGAVLLRGATTERGRRAVELRRGRTTNLTDGPGKLCQALAITGDHDGLDLADPDSPIRLIPGAPSNRYETTPRIGLTKATERQWRFVSLAEAEAEADC